MFLEQLLLIKIDFLFKVETNFFVSLSVLRSVTITVKSSAAASALSEVCLLVFHPNLYFFPNWTEHYLIFCIDAPSDLLTSARHLGPKNDGGMRLSSMRFLE